MPQTPAQLLDQALAALDEAATAASAAPIPHTKALAFVFAYLTNMAADEAAMADLRRRHPKAYFAEPDRRAFTELWRVMAEPLRDGGGSLDFGRTQTIGNLAGYVRRVFGREP
jgi:hypothetical protein